MVELVSLVFGLPLVNWLGGRTHRWIVRCLCACGTRMCGRQAGESLCNRELAKSVVCEVVEARLGGTSHEGCVGCSSMWVIWCISVLFVARETDVRRKSTLAWPNGYGAALLRQRLRVQVPP